MGFVSSGDGPQADLGSWRFDVFAVRDEELAALARDVLCLRREGDPRELDAFVRRVELLMTRHGNPYHNFRHGIDVAQTLFCFAEGKLLGEAGGRRAFGAPGIVFDDLEVHAMMLAGFCHDLDHPGLNNGFHVNCGHPLALRYNDRAVLEEWHAFSMWHVLRRPDCDILARYSAADVAKIRKFSVAGILATDMTQHGAITGGVRGLADAPEDPAKRDGHALTLFKGLVHAADVSNPAKPWAVSKTWSDVLQVEFFNQGDIEKHKGLPVSFGMDRLTTSQRGMGIGFGSKLVAPFYNTIVALQPDIKVCVDLLMDNVQTWTDMKEG